MFKGCHNLTTFNSDLSSLVDGGEMFYECNSLTTVSSNFSSLKTAVDMFYNCPLNVESITSVAENIPNLSEVDFTTDDAWKYNTIDKEVIIPSDKRGKITFNVSENLLSDENYITNVQTPLDEISSKRWDVDRNIPFKYR
jgi:hypothetical protein